MLFFSEGLEQNSWRQKGENFGLFRFLFASNKRQSVRKARSKQLRWDSIWKTTVFDWWLRSELTSCASFHRLWKKKLALKRWVPVLKLAKTIAILQQKTTSDFQWCVVCLLALRNQKTSFWLKWWVNLNWVAMKWVKIVWSELMRLMMFWSKLKQIEIKWSEIKLNWIELTWIECNDAH